MIANRIQGRRITKSLSSMTRLGVATVVAGGLLVAGMELSVSAQAASADTGNAQATVNSLTAQGYTVIVNKVGSAPLNQSTVTSVRLGRTVIRTDVGVHDHSSVTSRTVYVSVK